MNRRNFIRFAFSSLFIPGYLQASEWKSKWIKVISTAYCPNRCCCGDYADGKTATGRNAWKSGVAVDPGFIPLGCYLDIPGYKRRNGVWIKTDDVGGKVKGYHIDLRFKTHHEAIQYGRKRIKIRLWSRR